MADLVWVGLVYCNSSSNEWTCCDTSDKGTFPQSVDACSCTPESSTTNIAFAGPATLEALLSLPTAVGGPTSTFSNRENAPTTIISTGSAPSINTLNTANECGWPYETYISTGGSMTTATTSTILEMPAGNAAGICDQANGITPPPPSLLSSLSAILSSKSDSTVANTVGASTHSSVIESPTNPPAPNSTTASTSSDSGIKLGLGIVGTPFPGHSRLDKC